MRVANVVPRVGRRSKDATTDGVVWDARQINGWRLSQRRLFSFLARFRSLLRPSFAVLAVPVYGPFGALVGSG